ncbi:tripartite motif-containing protein 59 [Rana temporaria]|uniref:tripartite motif-containing protein 59 n=1 Tax=Rana temporaria TaxID=8407 RepID=UPI001AADA593|nr:tripartite motif-containing protein 59 [Rana temporaria]
MDHLIEDLTCSVCFNIYDDPRILKCSHTFCKSCLENINRSSDSYVWRISLGRLKCPTCRGITDVSIGVHTLPINFALKSIVEKFKSNKHFSVRTCPEHHGKQLKLFCVKDRKLICDECCEVGQHRKHPTEELERAYRKERKTASKLLAILREKNFTGVSTVIKALEEQLEECKTIIQEDKKEVFNFFDKTIEALERKKQDLLAALNDLDQKIVDVYSPKIEAMKQIQDEELDLLSLSSTTQDKDSPFEYLDNIHTIEKGMNALKKQQLCSVQAVEICPRVGQILKDQWNKSSIIDAHRQPTPKFEFRFNATRTANSSFSWTLCVMLLFLSLMALLCLVYPDMLLKCTNWCENYFLETMEPVLECFGIQMFAVKSTSQRMTKPFLDFVSYLYSLPSTYFY